MSKPLSHDAQQARAQRLMILGALSESSPEEKAKVEAAVSDIKAAVAKHGEIGGAALTIVMLEHVETNDE